MNPDLDWRPGAGREALAQRAGLYRRLRRFMDQRGILEVETPMLSRGGATDRHLHSLACAQPDGSRRWLHTSPEFPMKRLLAAGSGAIYQICRVFREGERGRLHNPEFTLLEWYRPGFDHHLLMDELEELLAELRPGWRCSRVTYAGVFRERLDLDPHEAQVEVLREAARIAGLRVERLEGDRDDWLDLLFSHCIAPTLGRGGPCLVHDYPASQAALARVRPGTPPVAERFELFIEGMEIANGFHELTDAAEQERRFLEDNRRRGEAGLPAMPPDHRLLAALEAGLPDCAGVAVGLDRLLMALHGHRHIDQVLAFPWERA
ncbi:MAG: EF-P lysine aminoacylase GenX [Gammaproteobacteria bacterium]|nr:MAG: EF-P lysine aminoacylase GenX [Gammaproteobacteria bacterium]